MENVNKLMNYDKKFFESIETLMYTPGFSDNAIAIGQRFITINKVVLGIENPDTLSFSYIGVSDERCIMHFDTIIDNYNAEIRLFFSFDLDGAMISVKKSIGLNFMNTITEV